MLFRSPGALLVVSHDRAFLNRLASEVWEIDQCRLEAYRGNLDGFAEQKAERLAVLMAQAEKEQANLTAAQKAFRQYAGMGGAGGTPGAGGAMNRATRQRSAARHSRGGPSPPSDRG
mgnify:CR=1 FL=1